MKHIRNVAQEHEARVKRIRRSLTGEIAIGTSVTCIGMAAHYPLIKGLGIGCGVAALHQFGERKGDENTRYESERKEVINGFVEDLPMFDLQVLNEFLNYQGEGSLRNIDLSEKYGNVAVEVTLERLNDLTDKTGYDNLTLRERLKSRVESAYKNP